MTVIDSRTPKIQATRHIMIWVNDTTICNAYAGSPFNFAVVFGPLLAGLCGLATTAFFFVKRQNKKTEEAMWRIRLKDLLQDSPPVVIGWSSLCLYLSATASDKKRKSNQF